MKTEYDRGKKDTISKTGDWVYVRNQKRKGGLSPYFEGPYPVLSRRGPNVKLRFRNGREKVVHLNRCKSVCLRALISNLNQLTQEIRVHRLLTTQNQTRRMIQITYTTTPKNQVPPTTSYQNQGDPQKLDDPLGNEDLRGGDNRRHGRGISQTTLRPTKNFRSGSDVTIKYYRLASLVCHVDHLASI